MRVQDFTVPSDPTRQTFSRDPSLVGLPVLAAFDFTTAYGRPGGATGVVTPVTNTTMTNYVDGAADAKAITDLGYGNKSVVFDSTDTLSLGNDFLLPTTCTDFVLYWWMKTTAVGANGFGNRIIAIRQNSTDIFWVVPTYSGSTLTTVEFGIANAAAATVLPAVVNAMIDGDLHMFAAHIQSNGSGQCRVRSFLDGELSLERPYYTAPTIPAKGGSDYGFMGKGNNVNGITGSVQKAGLIDMTGYTDRTADQIIAQIYDDHYVRLLAAIA